MDTINNNPEQQVTFIFRIEETSTLKIEAPTSSAILVIFYRLHDITLQKQVMIKNVVFWDDVIWLL
jgi:hypothetical protein